jgi:hypothetical protein
MAGRLPFVDVDYASAWPELVPEQQECMKEYAALVTLNV